MSGSDYTLTPNLGLYKPNFGLDIDNWGDHVNANSDVIDALLGGVGTSYLPLAGGTMRGTLTLAADPTSAMHAVTKQYSDTKLALAGGTVTGAVIFNAASAPVTVSSGLFTLGGASYGGNQRIQSAAGVQGTLQYSTNNLARWNVVKNTSTEGGSNQGGQLEIDAYLDTGAYSGILLQANRASGIMGLGRPEFTALAPWTSSAPRATIAGGNGGNYQNFIGATNAQPTSTLPANPITTASGSTTVTVNWPNCAATNGPLSRLQYETWVNLQGATAVGGITPAGWVKVVSTPNSNTFTFTWTSAASSTATGGASAVTVQPSYTTGVNQISSTEKTGATGFNLQTTELWNVDPFFLSPTSAPKYLQRWHWTCGPNDPTGASPWSLAGIEWDLTNRGIDRGYAPNAGNALNSSTGIWIGATTVPSWATGGGSASNWGSVFNVYSTQEQTGVGTYNAFINQPNALVGAGRDPTGHGGVAFDAFGALHSLSAAPYTTAIGTSNIKINVPAGFFTCCKVGDPVYVGTGYTIAGVSWTPGIYTITALDAVNGLTFQGTGTASATTSGGGAAGIDWYALVNLEPYAPYQITGAFKHGIITNSQSRFESGGIIETQPGNGILWSDGTGTASINSVRNSAGNIDLLLTPAGTGGIKPAALQNAANDSAAASAGVSVGSMYRNGSQLMVRVA